MKHIRNLSEGYSMEDAFRALNEKLEPKKKVSRKIEESNAHKVGKRVVESFTDPQYLKIKALVDSHDINKLAALIKTTTKCNDSVEYLVDFLAGTSDSVELFSAVCDYLAMNDVLCAEWPDLIKWWTITDGADFGAAWNIFIVNGPELYGAFAETQGNLFIDRMMYVDDPSEIQEIAEAHGLAETYEVCELPSEVPELIIDQISRKYKGWIEQYEDEKSRNIGERVDEAADFKPLIEYSAKDFFEERETEDELDTEFGRAVTVYAPFTIDEIQDIYDTYGIDDEMMFDYGVVYEDGTVTRVNDREGEYEVANKDEMFRSLKDIRADVEDQIKNLDESKVGESVVEGVETDVFAKIQAATRTTNTADDFAALVEMEEDISDLEDIQEFGFDSFEDVVADQFKTIERFVKKNIPTATDWKWDVETFDVAVNTPDGVVMLFTEADDGAGIDVDFVEE